MLDSRDESPQAICATKPLADVEIIRMTPGIMRTGNASDPLIFVDLPFKGSLRVALAFCYGLRELLHCS